MQIDKRALCIRFADKLKRERRARGLNQAQLAQAAGIKRTSITNYEQARHTPPLHVLYALCVALDIDNIQTLLPLLEEVLTPSRTSADAEMVDDSLEDFGPKTKAVMLELWPPNVTESAREPKPNK